MPEIGGAEMGPLDDLKGGTGFFCELWCGTGQQISSIVLCSIMTYPLELLPYLEAFLLQVTTASLLARVDPHPPLLPPSAYLPLPNFLASSLFLSPTPPGRLAPEISISPLLDPL